MKKILQGTERICLFCGKEKQQKYDEYTPYWECDCPDAVKKREIEKKIEELKKQIPRHKFEIVQKQVLISKINE